MGVERCRPFYRLNRYLRRSKWPYSDCEGAGSLPIGPGRDSRGCPNGTAIARGIAERRSKPTLDIEYYCPFCR